MATVEELIGFPTEGDYTPQHGGAMIKLVQLTDTNTKGAEPTVLLEDKPAHAMARSLTDFANSSGLTVNSVLAVNGNAVNTAFSNPSEVNEFNPLLFIIPAGKTVSDNKTVLKVQMLFISLFNHLLFLGRATKHTELPKTSGTFEEKFSKLQEALRSQDLKKVIFGEPVPVLITHFEGLKNELRYTGTTTFAEMMKYIMATPKVIMDFFLAELAKEAPSGSVPPAAPSGSVPPAAPSGSVPPAAPSGSVAPDATSGSVPPAAPPGGAANIDPSVLGEAMDMRSFTGGPPLSLMTNSDLRRAVNPQQAEPSAPAQGQAEDTSNTDSTSSTAATSSTARGFAGMSLPSTSSSTSEPNARRPSPRVSPASADGDPAIGISETSDTLPLAQPTASPIQLRTPNRAAAANTTSTSSSRSRRARFSRTAQRRLFNPNAPPVPGEGSQAAVNLTAANASHSSLLHGLAQPNHGRLRQEPRPGDEGDAPAPLSTPGLREGISAENASQRRRSRASYSPSAARRAANTLSNEVSRHSHQN